VRSEGQLANRVLHGAGGSGRSVSFLNNTIAVWLGSVFSIANHPSESLGSGSELLLVDQRID